MEMFTVGSMCPLCGKFHNNSACHSPHVDARQISFSAEDTTEGVRLSRIEFRLERIEQKLTEIFEKLSNRLDNQALK
jgi:hypothetical protein